MLPIQINKHNGIPIYVQLAEQVRLLIHQGRLTVGDLMPTVRELAVQLELNSNTVARVYRDLQHEGLLELRRGVGSFVSEKAGLQPLSAQQRHLLEKHVDGLIRVGHQMQLTPKELFQLIETRWKEKQHVTR